MCNVENICAGDPRITSWEVDYADSRSLENWVQKLDLMCEPDWKGALLGSISLFAMLISLPVLPPLSDKFGRKWFFIAGRFVECILYTVLMFTESWLVMLMVMGGFGLTSTARLTIGLTYF